MSPVFNLCLEADTWPRLGAKPKTRTCSTPSLSESLILVQGDKRCQNASRTPSLGLIQLRNKFAVLGKPKNHLPAYAGQAIANPTQPPATTSTTFTCRRFLKEVVLRLSRGHPGQSRIHHPCCRRLTTGLIRSVTQYDHSPHCQLPRPTTSIPLSPLHSNYITGGLHNPEHPFPQHYHFQLSRCHSPGHLQKTPRVAAIIATLNQSCGCTYANQQYFSSELTINCFIELFNLLNNCGKRFFISGRIPTLARGPGCFSRILSLNTSLHLQSPLHSFY